MSRAYISRIEEDSVKRVYLCSVESEEWKLVCGKVIEPLDPADPYHWKKQGDLITARRKDVEFIYD